MEQTPPSGPAQSGNGSAQTTIHVTGHGNDGGGGAEICEDFRLTDAQAQEFFTKAVSVTAAQIHDDDYLVLPCWAEGTTEVGRTKTTWKIRAGATADITDANGHVTYMGCKTCENGF